MCWVVLRKDLLYLAKHVLLLSVGRGACLRLQVSEQTAVI